VILGHFANHRNPLEPSGDLPIINIAHWVYSPIVFARLYVTAFVQVLGFSDHGHLTPLCRLYPLPVRQASILTRASFKFAVTHVPAEYLNVYLKTVAGDGFQ
jgi:hypothetical protein